MSVLLKDTPLVPSKAPNLPIAPVGYNQQYQDTISNALRLYFSQLDNYTQGLVGDTGGKYLHFPYIAAYDTTTQYATGNNTPTIVKWNTGSVQSFTLNANNTATVGQSGTYKITYSLQFENTDNTAAVDAIVWLRINGLTSAADVVGSSTIFTIPAAKSGVIPSYLCGYSEVVFDLNAGDTVGLWWGTATAATSGGTKGVSIFYKAAQTSPMAYPSTPSSLGSITFVSALPA